MDTMSGADLEREELPVPVAGRAIPAATRGLAGYEEGDRIDGDRPVVLCL